MRDSKFTPLKIILSLTIFFIIIFPLVSAVEVSMDPSFSQGETLLAKFSGNFIDQITRENVFFYRGHVGIPMVYGVVKIGDEFYVYALLTGKTEGNYSVSVEGVRYYKATQIVDDDIISNFTISNETAMFSVNPGVVSTEGDFSAELQNLQDRKITISISENSQEITSQTSLELKSGEKKNVFFNVGENAVKGIVNIDFSSEGFSYALPVYLDTNKTSNIIKNFEMEFQPSRVEVSMATDSDSKRILYLTNTGDETIEDIFFDVSPLLEPYVVISPEKINKLNPNSTEKIEIQIISDLNEAILEGKITAFTENFSTSFTLILDFVKDFIPADGEEDLAIVTLCADLGGTFCAETQECSGESVPAKDGICCLTECRQIEKSSTGKWIGWGLLLLAFGFLYWFYKKRYKRVSKRKAF
ncbi:MAG: hypothetical protein U1B79_01555 [Candidatus Pacearchaeota archaeon]|nr:hypothetical protein [Nanoarchaeota archaeon]MDZ4226776.1 hypothetical protein [Candidatus Pacearchaeota archaeon]